MIEKSHINWQKQRYIEIKDDSKIKRQKIIDRHGPRPIPNVRHLPDPYLFLITYYTFNQDVHKAPFLIFASLWNKEYVFLGNSRRNKRASTPA
jgi:hypothetical protein